jgi:integrase
MTKDDITRHAVNQYFKNHIEENEDISDKNTELIREFMKAQRGTRNRSKYREKRYLYKWKQLGMRFVDEDIEEMELTDWSRAIADLKEAYGDNSVNDYKGAIRQFYKQRYKNQLNPPERVQIILNSEELKDESEIEKEREENLFVADQVLKLSEVATNPRDACLPIYLLDAGARTEEVRMVDLGDIEPKSDSYTVSHHDCKNDKEDRDLPLTYCMETLRRWLEAHPKNREENPEAPLWCVVQQQGDGEYASRMSDKNINERLKELGRRAKKKYPKMFAGYNPESFTVYDFRRSSATLKGTEEGFGVQHMMWHYAWKDPERAKSYLRDDNERMRKAVLKKKGIEVKEDESSMERVDCSRCGHTPSLDASYCPSCSKPLSTSSAIEKEALLKAGEMVMEAKLNGETDEGELEDIVEEVKI